MGAAARSRDLALRSLRPRTTRPEGRRLSRRGFQINQRSLAKALRASPAASEPPPTYQQFNVTSDGQ
jgi:hypothetical protein